MIRRKYKEEFLFWKAKYDDCKDYIREARNIIIKHNLQDELNDVLNKKYGISLSGTILELNREFNNEK